MLLTVQRPSGPKAKGALLLAALGVQTWSPAAHAPVGWRPVGAAHHRPAARRVPKRGHLLAAVILAHAHPWAPAPPLVRGLLLARGRRAARRGVRREFQQREQRHELAHSDGGRQNRRNRRDRHPSDTSGVCEARTPNPGARHHREEHPRRVRACCHRHSWGRERKEKKEKQIEELFLNRDPPVGIRLGVAGSSEGEERLAQAHSPPPRPTPSPPPRSSDLAGRSENGRAGSNQARQVEGHERRVMK